MKPNDVLSGQYGLEGIQWALQGQPVRRKLRSAVSALLVDPAHLGSFLLRRSKFKPGSRLTAYYDVQLSVPDRFGPNHRSIEVDWRPKDDNLQPSESPDPLKKQGDAMQADAVRFGLAAPFRQLAVDLPHWGVRIQVFPLDAHFPQLVRLSDPHYVRDRLEAAGLIEVNGRNQPSDSRVAITPIRYRPGERHVLRIDWVETSDPVESRAIFFAKLYNNKGEGARRMHVAIQIADWLDGLDARVNSARPTAFLAEDETLLYPMISGAPLSQYLRHPGRKVAQSLSLAGATLHSLHGAPRSLTAELPLKTLESEIKVVVRAAQHVNVLLPEVGVKIKRMLDLIQDLHQYLPEESPTFTHSDFKADHLRVSGNGLTLIDFDTCSLADPASDIGKFLADLQYWYEVYSQTGVEQAQRQFLSGYGLRDSEARMVRGRLYEALILVKITLRRVPLFDRNWAGRTEWLIDRAGQSLRGLAVEIGSHP